MIKAAFIDRDGVITFSFRRYIRKPSELKYIPGALEAIAKICNAGYKVFIITNQPGVSLGRITEEQIESVHSDIIKNVKKCGGAIDEIVYCPHSKREVCGCRKPKSGLIEDIINRYDVQLKESIVVGDRWSDILTAQSVGCKAFLVLTGWGILTSFIFIFSRKTNYKVIPSISYLPSFLVQKY